MNTNAPITSLFASLATYTYNASHKHAVASLSTGEMYTYDANGNMITRVEGGLTYTQTFDAENRLISVAVSGQTTQFVYDGDGNLVKKIKPDNSKTIYVGGVYEVDKASGGSIQRTVTYYPVAGAMRIDSTLYYTLKDHLGSASVITNASGVTVSGGEQRYYPYGESRLTATMITDKLFTGQREMAGLGIYHYGARFYSPKLGRFLSPDTLIPGAANPQAYNRYSYVLGNPLKYTDPSGHSQCQTQEDCDDMGTTPMGTGGSGGNGTQEDVTEFTALEMQSIGVEIEALQSLYGGMQGGFIYGWMLGTFGPIGPKHIKVAMGETIGDGVILCGSGGCRWVDYSTPGNILFGYAAAAANMPEDFYSWVGGFEQVKDDFPDVQGDWCSTSYCDDPADLAAVEFGASLYTSGDDLTLQEFQNALTTDVLDSFQAPPDTFVQPFDPYPQENHYVPGDFDYSPD